MTGTNATAVIPATGGLMTATVVSQLGLCAAAGTWLYNKLLTEPLRIFYFVGPVWGNLPPAEVCARITTVDAQRWASTPELQQACVELLDRKFTSFDAGVMTTLYFTFLTFVALQLFCRCCFLRPIMRDIRGK